VVGKYAAVEGLINVADKTSVLLLAVFKIKKKVKLSP
jgi:hypothetical protein